MNNQKFFKYLFRFSKRSSGFWGFFHSKWHLFQNFTYSHITEEINTFKDWKCNGNVARSVPHFCYQLKYIFLNILFLSSVFRKGKKDQNLSISHLIFTPNFTLLSHLLLTVAKIARKQLFIAIKSTRKSSDSTWLSHLQKPTIYINTRQHWKCCSN